MSTVCQWFHMLDTSFLPTVIWSYLVPALCLFNLPSQLVSEGQASRTHAVCDVVMFVSSAWANGHLGYFSLCSMARSPRVVPWHSPAHIHLGWQPPMQPLLPHRARFEDGHRLLLFLPTQMQKVSYIISSLL